MQIPEMHKCTNVLTVLEFLFTCQNRTHPGNQYPVETCTSMPSLLSLPSCDFTFPLNICTANPKLFTLPQCSGKMGGYLACMWFWHDFFVANLTPKICATTPSITTSPVCSGLSSLYALLLSPCLHLTMEFEKNLECPQKTEDWSNQL